MPFWMSAHVHAQEAVDLPHPLAVAAGQVVVDGDDVHVVAGERVQVAGKRGRRASCPRRSSSRRSARRCRAMPPMSCTSKCRSPSRAHAGLAHGRERFGQDGVFRSSPPATRSRESRGERAQLVVRFRLHPAFEAVDACCHGGLVVLQLLALAQREEPRKETCHVMLPSFSWLVNGDRCYSSIPRLVSKEIHTANSARPDRKAGGSRQEAGRRKGPPRKPPAVRERMSGLVTHRRAEVP